MRKQLEELLKDTGLSFVLDEANANRMECLVPRDLKDGTVGLLIAEVYDFELIIRIRFYYPFKVRAEALELVALMTSELHREMTFSHIEILPGGVLCAERVINGNEEDVLPKSIMEFALVLEEAFDSYIPLRDICKESIKVEDEKKAEYMARLKSSLLLLTEDEDTVVSE